MARKSAVATVAAPEVESVSSVHVVGFVSSSISTDGTSAMVVLMVAGEGDEEPRKFALTCPVQSLPLMRAMFHGALAQIGPRRVTQDQIVFRTLGPGGAEQIDCAMVDREPSVIMRFNPDRAEEIDIGITPETALRLAVLLNQIPDQMAKVEAAKQVAAQAGADANSTRH